MCKGRARSIGLHVSARDSMLELVGSRLVALWSGDATGVSDAGGIACTTGSSVAGVVPGA